mmetsp:Transcript_36896/g.56659  ORF Transcript_36896/g.56659 Transcript_36896/m.56659 type:complete len:176 (-) Transcript_36896:19-546(-)
MQQYMTRGLCHRDLSLENIMLSEDGRTHHSVIIDFGMSFLLPMDELGIRCLVTRQIPCGKESYMSPEIRSRTEFDGFSIDIWSAGVMLFMLLVGQKPFEMAHTLDWRFRLAQTQRLPELLNSLAPDLSDEAIDLLNGMLQVDPNRRFTFQRVRDHQWMNDRGLDLPVPVDEGWRD